jgi:hypothetical protein
MIVLQLLPIVLSLLLLGAHFLRSGQFVLLAVCLLGVGLLVVPRPWAARVLQIFLVLGALEWVRTIVFFMGVRAELGQPYLRFLFVLGPVALLTGLSALVFRAARPRRWFRLGGRTPAAPEPPGDPG